MTREPLPPLTQEQQARLLAVASVPYATWIRAQFDRWGFAWREKFATPMEDPQRKDARR